MSYIKNNLLPGEQVTYEAKISLWSLLPAFIIGLILIPFFIGLLVWLAIFLRYISTEMAVTNQRVMAKTGFIRRDTVEINIDRIESIRVQQVLLGRIFNYGSIVLAGAGYPQAPFKGIAKPLDFRRAFEITRHKNTEVKTSAELLQ